VVFFGEKGRDINSLVDRAQQGDGAARETLLSSYRPFIMKAVSRNWRRNTDLAGSDEFSIGLIAFNEAIDKYKFQYARSFLSFAEEVIGRRIIDYCRAEHKNSRLLPFSSFEHHEEQVFRYQSGPGDDPTGEEVAVKEDFKIFLEQLKEFHIKLDDLVANTPKHLDSRLLAIRIAREITGNPDMLQRLREKKKIPLKSLQGVMKVNPKTVVRHRKYIIAICLVLTSNLDVLKGYVRRMPEGGEGGEL